MPLRLDIKRRLTARFDLCFLSNWRICLKSSLHHSTSLIVQVGPSEVLRPSSYRTVDARVSLQWQRSHLELREPAARQVVWGGRPFLGSIFPLVGVRSSFSHFQVCDLPVRAAVFVPRKNWVVTGSDDMQVDTIFTSTFWLKSWPLRSVFSTTTRWRDSMPMKRTQIMSEALLSTQLRFALIICSSDGILLHEKQECWALFNCAMIHW